MVSWRSFGLFAAWIVAACSGGAADGQSSAASGASVAPSSSAPVAVLPPQPDECEALWTRYQHDAPEDPFMDREGFVARCVASERPVLQCLEKAREELLAIVRETGGPGATLDETFARIGLPSRIGPCITRERVRAALRTGELDALAKQVASGQLAPKSAADGDAVVPSGSFATLAWRGTREGGAVRFELAPPGQLRVTKRPDGRVWIYVLGGLMGRHQNQVGFLYASGPFVPGDFERQGGEEQVRLGPEAEERGPAGYRLQSFTVAERISPQLLFVGSAPD